MISRRPKRGRKATKRLDLTDIRAVMRDNRVWSGLAIVVQPDDGPYWQIIGTDGEDADIHVEVVLQPSGVPLTARLRAGVWEVPAVGDEVAVIIPDGATDFQPIILGILSTGSVPNPSGQGPAPGRILLVKPSVMVHDGAGGAASLALKSDVEAVEAHVVRVDNKYATHIHSDSTTAPTTGPVQAGSILPNGSPPPNYFDGTALSPADPADIVGTSVLLAK